MLSPIPEPSATVFHGLPRAAAPGPLVRATAGDFLRTRVDNQLPAETTVHWLGIALCNVADGVPGLTPNPIAPGASYLYEFTAPDPGTYFYHPYVGVQLDRGLYAPLIIDNPHETGDYDQGWAHPRRRARRPHQCQRGQLRRGRGA